MKKLLSVFFVLVVVMGSTSLHAQNFFLTDDDEREIPLNPAGPKEGGPVARSIIIQPASAYINNDIVTVVSTVMHLLQVLQSQMLPEQMFIPEQVSILR